MTQTTKHAGVHWPENAGGEHPSREAITNLPGVQGAVLICSPSARFHYGYLRSQAPNAIVVWRAIPLEGEKPAQLRWDASRVAAACLNLWDEQPENAPPQHATNGEAEYFCPLNELQFDKENGGPFPGYGKMAQNIGRLRLQLRKKFAEEYPEQNVKLVFPAWVPSDDGDHLDDWRGEAEQWDVIGLHAYGAGETMRSRYESYRNAFPNSPIFVGEWNSNHNQHDEYASLEMWADIASTDPLFLGATYFIWETNNQGEQDLSIWGNPSRLSIFQHPPTASEPVPTPTPEPEPLPEPEPTPVPVPPAPPVFFTPEQIALATGCPLENVQMYWPKLVEQMQHAGIYDRAVCLGLIGTIAIESASQFKSVEEAFWLSEEDRQAEYVRRNYDGGPNYHGRGGIQHTHIGNYERLGPKIAALWGTDPDQPDFNLVSSPENLLDQDFGAAADVIYFRDTATLQGYSLVDACRGRDWEWVRRLVYGGRDEAGEQRIQRIVEFLEGTTVPKVTYNANEPSHLQENPWDCSQESLEWAMFSLGRHPDDDWMEQTMIAEGVLTPEDGLLDATGKSLAEFVQRQWGEFGFLANNETDVSFTFMALEGGHTYPLLMGGKAWNHWVGVRGYDANRDLLLLSNPSPGYKGVGDTMNEEQFKSLGPFNMVRVWHPDLLPEETPVPEPTPLPEPLPEPPTPVPPTPVEPAHTKAFLLGEIRKMLDELEGQS